VMANNSDRIRILALGAHPDDIEVGCGGALLHYANRGQQIFLMIMTEGELGGDAHVRAAEQGDAAKILGAEKVYWGGYPDTAIPNDRGLVQKIERVVREVNPHMIFVHFPDDTHQDHRHLAMSTVSATRYTKNVLFYEGPTTQQFSPTVFVDIGEVLDAKIRALQAHASQVNKTNVEGLSIVDVTTSAAHFRGIQGRVKSAEGFVPLRMFLP
ncbi:MAG: PIG-L family deacetylase, partial [Nitrospirota bacterium]|nr:PIG-L family deacetylase [Nitrospirota bacterium]